MRTNKTFENLSSRGSVTTLISYHVNVAHLMFHQFWLNIGLRFSWQNVSITGFYSEFICEVIFFVIGNLYTKFISFFFVIKMQYNIFYAHLCFIVVASPVHHIV